MYENPHFSFANGPRTRLNLEDLLICEEHQTQFSKMIELVLTKFRRNLNPTLNIEHLKKCLLSQMKYLLKIYI